MGARKKPPAASTEDLALVTVRYTADMLTAINQKAAKLGLDRGNFLRSSIAEALEWDPDVEPVQSDQDMIAVTIRLPPKMYEAFVREAARNGLDKSNFGRMLTLRKADWTPK